MAHGVSAFPNSHTCGINPLSFPFLFPFSYHHSHKFHLPFPLSFPFLSMAETTALCFPSVPLASRSCSSSFSPLFRGGCCLPSPRWPASRTLRRRLVARGSGSGGSGSFLGSGGDEDLYGLYPWEHQNSDNSSIQWVREDKVTLFTYDGLIQIGGSLVPRRITSPEKQGRSKASRRYQRFQEKDYMDPSQSLCLGALFDIAATNGHDMGRRLCIIGFCRSIEMLSDVVEDTVLEHGGEVVVAEKASNNGLHEKLNMTVAVPLLWGVPPVSETLHLAVRTGGGIIDKVFWQWYFL
ncbi:hypothetical protein Drorol1_Dr00013881 [Drosera rotundifolia]